MSDFCIFDFNFYWKITISSELRKNDQNKISIFPEVGSIRLFQNFLGWGGWGLDKSLCKEQYLFSFIFMHEEEFFELLRERKSYKIIFPPLGLRCDLYTSAINNKKKISSGRNNVFQNYLFLSSFLYWHNGNSQAPSAPWRLYLPVDPK